MPEPGDRTTEGDRLELRHDERHQPVRQGRVDQVLVRGHARDVRRARGRVDGDDARQAGGVQCGRGRPEPEQVRAGLAQADPRVRRELAVAPDQVGSGGDVVGNRDDHVHRRNVSSRNVARKDAALYNDPHVHIGRRPHADPSCTGRGCAHVPVVLECHRDREPCAERHFPEQRRHRPRLPRRAGVRQRPRRRRDPGVVGPDHPHQGRHGPVRRRGLRRPGARPVRRRHDPRLRRGRQAHVRAPGRQGRAGPGRRRRLPAGPRGRDVVEGRRRRVLHGRRVRDRAGRAAGRPDRRGRAVLRRAQGGLPGPVRADGAGAGPLRRGGRLHHAGRGAGAGGPDPEGVGRDPAVPLLPGGPRVLQRREPAGHPRPGAGEAGLEPDGGVPAAAPS